METNSAANSGIQGFNPYDPLCPTRAMLDRIGDKWTVLILGLLLDRPCRFNLLMKEIAGISQKVLSQTLKALERDGLVTRKAFPTVPVTVEYSITSLGRTLADRVALLAEWAEQNAAVVLANQSHYDHEKNK
jgi:DNA-binding HxlR family transcriptional regulator